MSFGKNPYVAKAQAAELKADEAADSGARARAFREAAHEWERAASREPPGKRRNEYADNAERNRLRAEGDVQTEASVFEATAANDVGAPAKKPLLN
jgi:hypothetical protein